MNPVAADVRLDLKILHPYQSLLTSAATAGTPGEDTRPTGLRW
jgi:hypothetical protein